MVPCSRDTAVSKVSALMMLTYWQRRKTKTHKQIVKCNSGLISANKKNEAGFGQSDDR